VWHSVYVENSDFRKKFLCWENGVLQLVSEQVGPSGQVVELCRVVWRLKYCLMLSWFLLCFLTNGYVYYVIMFDSLTLMWLICFVWSFYLAMFGLRCLGNNWIYFLVCFEFRGRNSFKGGRVVTPSLNYLIYLIVLKGLEYIYMIMWFIK